jgi:hypothetical protein
MRLAESGLERGDAAGLAMTLIRTFGGGALTLVEEQVSTAADYPGLQARWTEVRDALAILAEANTHMEAALDLLDRIEETSVPPMLDRAIVQLGLREDAPKAAATGATVAGCSSEYLENKARDHLVLAQQCAELDEKTRHLHAASSYATLREQIVNPIRPGRPTG